MLCHKTNILCDLIFPSVKLKSLREGHGNRNTKPANLGFIVVVFSVYRKHENSLCIP